MDKKFIWIGIAAVASVAFLTWLFMESTKPLPGQKQALDCDNTTDFSKQGSEEISDKCRAHVPTGTEVNYQTNPATLGPHYADWVRAGVYGEPKDDRNMVHSLEHGYVILSYKCGLGGVEGKEATEGAKIATSASGETRNDDVAGCGQRKAELERIYNKKDKRKLIVVPRPNLDTSFAITAWQYIDKFDPSTLQQVQGRTESNRSATGSGLSVSDIEKIEKFIDAHRDNGPERTME